MRVLDILRLCHENDVKVALGTSSSGRSLPNGGAEDHGSLTVTAKGKSIPVDIKDILLRHKNDIIEFLTDVQGDADSEEIRPDRRSGHYPLSYAQQRLWFLAQYMGPNAVYNTQSALELSGEVDVGVLCRCLRELVKRHDALRTRFENHQDSVVQVVDANGPELSVETVHDEDELRRICREERDFRFDLARDSLCRTRVVADTQNDRHVLLVTLHHSIADGASRAIFFRELLALYEAFRQGRPSPLKPLRIQYTDYAAWQRQSLGGEALNRQLDYWCKQLSKLPSLLNLPTDRPRPVEQTFRGNTLSLELAPALTKQLHRISRDQGVTLFSTLLTAFHVLLSRYSGQLDIATGIPIANRTRRDTESMIGFLANTLVLRGDLSMDPTFSDLLRRTHATALQAYANQDLPFEVLVEHLNPERSLSSSPLFQVMFAMQNAPVTSATAAGLEVSPLVLETSDAGQSNGTGSVARFDLTLSVEQSPSGLKIDAEYNTDLFERGSIERLLGHYRRLLSGLKESLHTRVSRIEFLSEAERLQQIVGWNSIEADHPDNACMHELFEQRVRKSPQRIAVITDAGQLSYADLNSRANQLAHFLVAQGVGPESRIGLCAERSVELIIGLLGILKAGACYVPLDPTYPASRLSYLIGDSGVGLIVTHASVRTAQGFSEVLAAVSGESESEREIRCFDVDQDDSWCAASYPTHDPRIPVDPFNLAYLIYTSGSTGLPKGVAVCHNGWVNLARAQIDRFGIGEDSCVLQFSSLSFDASAFELCMMFGGGATIYVLSEDERQSPEAITAVTQRHKITHATLPPSLLPALDIERFRPETTLIVAGEAISTEAATRWAAGRRLFNAYGPTETTVCATAGLYTPGRSPHLGQPLANLQCYVLDGAGQLLPVGVVGELYVGGAGLARGYLNRASLTAQRFVPNPFSEVPGERLYRTGDLVRYLADGNLEFIGREDHQVKLRGFRIELGEIESVLLQHDQVREAVVLARAEEGEDKRLVAYVVGRQEPGDAARQAGELIETLQGRLQARLPLYMVPAAIVVLDALPLTANGKVDRQALPAPDVTARHRDYVAPVGVTEELLGSLWCAVLGRERVSRDDNFFELGGHSLLATRLVSRIRDAFAVELPIRALFEQQTLRAQAGAIGQAGEAEPAAVAPIVAVERDGPLALSYAQQRLWFLHQYMGPNAVYNMPLGFRLSGAVDTTALLQSLEAIVARHEALRTRFEERDGGPVQVIDPPSPGLRVETVADEAALREICAFERQYPFDLSRDKLCRIRVLSDPGDASHVLLVTLHHSVSDGWSLGIFFRELEALYRAFSQGQPSPLSPLPIQYADYAHWQRQWLSGGVLAQQLSYWREQLSGLPPLLRLPVDRPRPAEQTYHGSKRPIRLSEALSQRLQRLSQEQGVTLFMTLLSAFAVLLSRYSGQTDVAIGTPIANRTRRETESLMGFFVNTLVMRCKLDGDPGFVDLLKRTREMALQGYAHQDIPFEQLVEELNPQRSLSHSPLFQVMFALQNSPADVMFALQDIPAGSMSFAGLELQSLSLAAAGRNNGRDDQGRDEQGVSRFDLTLNVQETPDGIMGTMEFNSDLFDGGTIERLLLQYERLLEALAASPQTQVSQIECLSEAERHQQLVDWNATSSKESENACIHELFERQAAAIKQTCALVCGRQQLSYEEINRRANRLAHCLLERGAGPGVVVGVFLERSADLAIALLGILKTGACYMLLDAGQPLLRLKYLIEDSGLGLLVTDSQARALANFAALSGMESAGIRCLTLDQADSWSPQRYPQGNPQIAVSKASAAAVMYDCSVAGAPRAVAISHESLVSLLVADSPVGLTRDDVIAQVADISRETIHYELLGGLACGSRVVVIDKDAARDPTQLARIVARQGITVVLLASAVFNRIGAGNAGGFAPLRKLIVKGDALSMQAVEAISTHTPAGMLLHLYGPTQCAGFATAYEPEPDAPSLCLGRPLPGRTVYVVAAGKLVPQGAVGELCLGGAGVARHYLNDAWRAAEQFIPDPYGGHDAGARLFRTGRLARYLSDGSLQLVEPVGTAWRPRAERLEHRLAEVERTLLQHDAVESVALTVMDEESAQSLLLCYVVLTELAREATRPEKISVELRRFLRMQPLLQALPSVFFVLDALPLTANGKVDRQALPAPDVTARHRDYVAPVGVTEELLGSLWCAVLGRERVSRDDNFFELGGHSLLATRLVSRIRDAFAVELPIRALFEQQTLRAQAGAIGQAGEAEPAAVAPIVAVERDGPLALSYAQQRLWFLHQYMGPNAVYNMPLGFRLSGAVDTTALLQSLEAIVARHEALRTRFEERDGGPVQVIDPPSPGLRVETVADETALREICAFERQYPFDLSRDKLCRIRVLSDPGDASHVLLVTLHHSVSDGWSLGIFFRELEALYRAFSQGQPSPLSPLPIQYADYAHWQRQWLSGGVLAQQLSYWREQLSGLPPLLRLPVDRPRPAEQTYHGSKRPIRLSEALSQRLQRLSQEQGVTLFMTLLSAFAVLLSRYSGQTDVAIGTPIANRTRRETESLMGFFVNTLVMRCKLDGDPGFVDLLKRTREMALQGYAHQDIPFEQLVEELNPQRSLSHSPLFQVWFVLESELAESMSLGNLELTPLQFAPNEGDDLENPDKGVSRFDMALSLLESESGIGGHMIYNTDLFTADTMDSLVMHFVRLLEALVESPEQRVTRIEFLSETEKRRQLVAWNDAARFDPLDECVNGLFETQARLKPQAPALIFDEREMTYEELNRCANRLAHHLREQGAEPDSLIALCMLPSFEMVIALLGILKSGAAYVPLDPSYPQERLTYMLDDCGADLVLTQSVLLSGLPLQAQRTLCLDDKDAQDALANYPDTNPERGACGLSSEHLAYVIYTSGSTGRPKGVMISHRNVCDFLLHAVADFLPAHVCGAVVSSPLAFDATVGSLLVPLCAGKYAELLEEGVFALDRLGDRLQDDEEALLFKVTPSHLAAIVAKGFLQPNRAARHVIVVAGEALGIAAIEHWTQNVLPASRFINEYGPTETTVGATTYPIAGVPETGTATVPVGRPLGDTRLYVLNEQMALERIGSIGELFIGGAGLARGYLNRASLTAQRFVPNPFSEVPGERLYRTGDLVRYLADGNLEFIGREDHQVKLRGFRIELGEIESVLLQHDQVREAVVLARAEEGEDKRLVAYVVGRQEPGDAARQAGELIETLQELLQARLPLYMVPAAIVVLDALPLTANGKVDRQALPAPDVTARHRDYVAPVGVTEELLGSLWCAVLGRERVSRDDNFFELGGHSLLATRLVSRIRDAFAVELPIRALFEQQTLRAQAGAIGQAGEAEPAAVAPIVAVERDGPLALSYAQQRLWFLHQYMGPNAVYNMPLGFRLSGAVDTTALLQSLEAIVARHEALRTRFEERDGGPVQVIDPPSPGLRVETVADETALREICAFERQYPFDLSRDKLCRIRVLSDPGDASHVLLVTLHHSVSDGWSLGIFFRELEALYRAFSQGQPSPLSPLPIQYADYAHWQRQWLSGGVLAQQLSYWREQLSGLPPLLRLPVDRPRPAEQTYHGSKRPIRLSEALSQRLQRLSQEQGVTLFMTLLSAFAVLLSRYSGQTDVAIGTPIANRTRRETESLMGFFVNTLVMRCKLDGDPGFVDLLKRTREMALQGYAHQDIPFEQLVEELNPQRSLSHSPLFQVMFALRNVPMESLSLGDLGIERLSLDDDALGVSRFDLTLSLVECDGDIQGIIEYNTDLFDGTTIDRFIAHYLRLLDSVVAQPDLPISQLEILGEAERDQLDDWNDTRHPYPEDCCLHELFEAQAELTPDGTGLVYRDQSLTYRQLNDRANQVASCLHDAGVVPDTFVGLCVERSVDMVVGILGILKSGAAYVPIDPGYPAARIRYLLKDSAVDLVLSQSHLRAELPVSGQRVIFLDNDSDSEGNTQILSSQPADNLDRQKTTVSACDLAYVIYTSGSTGKPKGVLLEHKNAVAFMYWAKASFSKEELRAVLASTTMCFDLSIFEIFSPWMVGGHVVLVDDMLQLISESRVPEVSLINTVPSAISALASAKKIPATVKTVNLAGEPLRQSVVDLVYETSGVERVNNLYGPSEYTTYTTATSVEAGSRSEPTIGKPIHNTRIYILGDDLSLRTVGAVGQLHIAGDGMARGYLNQDELTADKFVASPFGGDSHERLYRTGDLARWLPDGNLEFLGRADDQVKIRGFRIELGEIESYLLQHELIKEAVVLAREDEPDDKQLVAYIVVHTGAQGEALSHDSDSRPIVDELRAYLQVHLPAFMLPTAILVMDAMPLTLNGKIDRKALPAPDRSRQSPGFASPQGQSEEMLASLWCEVLNCERVSRFDNFFALGGHSLKATQLASRIRQAFELEVPIRLLFYQQTLMLQAQAIAELSQREDASSRRSGRLRLSRELTQQYTGALEEGEI